MRALVVNSQRQYRCRLRHQSCAQLCRRVALPAEFLRLRFSDLEIKHAAADPLPAGQEAMGFPTGIYLQLGGDLPGF